MASKKRLPALQHYFVLMVRVSLGFSNPKPYLVELNPQSIGSTSHLHAPIDRQHLHGILQVQALVLHKLRQRRRQRQLGALGVQQGKLADIQQPVRAGQARWDSGEAAHECPAACQDRAGQDKIA